MDNQEVLKSLKESYSLDEDGLIRNELGMKEFALIDSAESEEELEEIIKDIMESVDFEDISFEDIKSDEDE